MTLDEGFKVGDDELKALADVVAIDDSFNRGWFRTGYELENNELIALTEAVISNDELDRWF